MQVGLGEGCHSLWRFMGSSREQVASELGLEDNLL